MGAPGGSRACRACRGRGGLTACACVSSSKANTTVLASCEPCGGSQPCGRAWRSVPAHWLAQGRGQMPEVQRPPQRRAPQTRSPPVGVLSCQPHWDPPGTWLWGLAPRLRETRACLTQPCNQALTSWGSPGLWPAPPGGRGPTVPCRRTPAREGGRSGSRPPPAHDGTVSPT